MTQKLTPFLLALAVASLVNLPVYADENIPLFPIYSCHGGFGFINSAGKVVIKPQFSWVNDFSEGRAGVVKNKQTQVIDTVGNIIKENVSIGPYSEGLAAFSLGNIFEEDPASKDGYLDNTGKIVIAPQYDTAGNFSEGLAPVKIGHKWGYIDNTGKIVMKPTFDYANTFNDGLAAVTLGGKIGYIDKTGTLLIPPQYQMAYPYSDGIARIKVGDKYSYINKAGKRITDQQFDDANDFSENLAKVKVGNLWGYLDTNGKMIITPQYSWTTDFADGLAGVIPKGQKALVYIDNTGKTVLRPSPTFDFAYDRLSADEKSDYLSDPEFKHNRYVDKQGKKHIKLPCTFWEFNNGLAAMDCGYPGLYDKMGYMNTSGKIVWDPTNSCPNPPSGP